MIQYNSKNAYLEIPKGLGNLGGNSGGGTDVSALSGSVVELQSTVESEAARLNGLSAITENIASQATSAAAGVNTLSGAVETLSSQVDSQGDAIADLILDSDALDARVSANTEAIEALSGVTGDVASLSAQTSANTAQIEALSAATEDLSATTEDIYNEVFYEEEGERHSYIGDLQDAMDEKQDVLEAGDGISLDSPTISVKAGKGLYFKEDGKMEIRIGDGLAFSGSSNALTVKIGEGLAFSGDTLVADGGGGIEKVDVLPATAEEGDVVWLNGQTGITGYTVTATGDNWASWPWELDRNYFNIDNRTISIRGSQRIGKWTKTNDLFNGWENYPGLLMRARRNSTDGGPVYDFIDPTGQYTITAGNDAASITTNSFDFRGSLYVYSGGKWYRKAEREVLISETGTTVENLVRSIWCGIEDADYDDLVIRYAPNGRELREFKIYISTFYGIDMQCSDDRETGEGWGRLNVKNLRMKIDGSIEDLVGERWIVSQDQIPETTQSTINLDSTGAYTNPDELGAFSSEQCFKIWFRCNGANGTDWGMVPAKYVWRRIESINGEDKLVYYWAIENLFINGTAYKGSWHSIEWDWSNYVTDSWTAQ